MKYLFQCLFYSTIIILFASCGKDDPVMPQPMPEPDCPGDWVHAPSSYSLEIPKSLPKMNIPSNNVMTIQGVALGRLLFYDPILSGDNTLACAGCHLQENGFTDPDQFSEGIDGDLGDRNAMQIINLGYANKLFWDGRVEGLENQALEPVENPVEMHETWPNAISELADHNDYPKLFYEAFGTCVISKELAAKALAQFERTLISGNSKFDKVTIGGMGVFFTDEELNGFDIFFTEKGDCFHCHGGALFTDNEFHNNGLDSIILDLGLENATENIHDRGKFKAPTLRNIELTAPYMHDGRFKTLEEVIDFYSDNLQFSETLDPLMKNVSEGGIQLSPKEKTELLAFLKTLTDRDFVTNENFSTPL
ncbi:MAG: cytochrome c peroxidase [Saprospiraceae bacterium]